MIVLTKDKQIKIDLDKLYKAISDELATIVPEIPQEKREEIASSIDPYKIPQELQSLKKFVGGKIEGLKDNGHIAKSIGYWKQEKNQLQLDRILQKIVNKQSHFLAFVLENTEYFCLDLDNLGDLGAPEVQEILDRFPSYQEKSFSCSGLHILVKGDKSIFNDTKKKADLASGGDIEIKTSGVIALTGNTLASSSNKVKAADQGSLKWLIEKYLKKADTIPQKTMQAPAFEGMQEDQLLEFIDSRRDKNLWDLWIDPDCRGGDKSKSAMGLWEKIAYYLQSSDRDRIYSFAIRSPHYSQLDPAHKKQWTRDNYLPIAKIASNISTLNTHKEEERSLISADPATVPAFEYPDIEITITAKGDPKYKVINTWGNTDYLLTFLGYKVRRNEITRDIDLFCVKDGAELQIYKGLDNFSTYLEGKAQKTKYYIDSFKILQHLAYIAERNKYNPYLEYLENCHRVWENAGKPNVITSYFDKIFMLDRTKITDQDIVLLHSFWQKWLINACRLAGNEGQDNLECIGVLILQGAQGIGKTRFGRWLMPIKDLLCTGGKIDPDSKDTILQITASALCELGEFGRSQKDIDGIKAFITQTKDRIRKPYARTHEDYFRHTAFYGTVNEVDFLKDDTGNRRYMIVPLKDLDQNAIKASNVKLLWGQAFDLAKNGAIDYLTREEIAQQGSLNLAHRRYTELQQAIIDYFDIDISKKWTQERELYFVTRTAKQIGDLAGFLNSSRKVMAFLRMLSREGVIPPEKVKDGYSVFTLKR